MSLLSACALGQFSLTTTYASNNGQDGNMFDLIAVAPVLVSSFDGNLDPGTHNIEIYMVTGGGTFHGNEGNAAAWTLVGSATGVVSAGNDVPTAIPIPINVVIPPGQTQGFYFTTDGPTSLNYTNGTNFLGVTAMDANLQITEGTGNDYPFGATYPSAPAQGGASRIWNGTVHYTLVSTFADDMTVSGIDAPVGITSGCGTLSATEPVTISVFNLGSNTVAAGTAIPVSYTVDDGVNPPITVSEIYMPSGPLAQFATDTYTFTATADLSVPGSYVFDATVTLPGDQDPSNDTLTGYAVGSGGALFVASFPYSESFDGSASPGTTTPPLGWEQDTTDATGTNSDWIFTNTTTPSSGTGPAADHTTGVAGQGYYGYVEDASSYLSVNLLSPCLGMYALGNPTLKFWMHSENGSSPPTSFVNVLSVDVLQYPGPTTFLDVVPPIGTTGSDWTLQVVDLSMFAGSLIQVRFRGTSAGGSSLHDVAIDDVEVFDAVPSLGQPPQPGLAELDINDASNGGGLPVPFGANGPYFTTVTPGEVLEYTFSGQIDQPVILLFGNLNVGSFAFPGVGQLDIGGPLDPMTGLPTGISVLANGTVPSGINVFFNTGPLGTAYVRFTLPNLPLGVLTTFQSLILNGTPSVVGLTNAVELTIQ